MKVWQLALPALVLALLASMFAQRQLAAATQSCPTSWVRVLTDKGVMVCGKQNAAATQQSLVAHQEVERSAPR